VPIADILTIAFDSASQFEAVTTDEEQAEQAVVPWSVTHLLRNRPGRTGLSLAA